MNLKEIRTKFVETSGRFDLVVDTTDYADNGADFFIQAAQRWLDVIQPAPMEDARYQNDIVSGDYKLLFKYGRRIERVEVWNAEGIKQELDRKRLAWLRDNYTKDPDNLDSGVPKYWAPGVFRLSPEQEHLRSATELITNGNFTGDADGWTLGAGWTYGTNAVDRAAAAATDLEQDFSGTVGTEYRVIFTISNYVAGTLTPYIGTAAGTAVSADGTYTQTITAAGSGVLKFTPDASFDGTIDSISVLEMTPYTDDFTFNAETMEFN